MIDIVGITCFSCNSALQNRSNNIIGCNCGMLMLACTPVFKEQFYIDCVIFSVHNSNLTFRISSVVYNSCFDSEDFISIITEAIEQFNYKKSSNFIDFFNYIKKYFISYKENLLFK